MNVFIDSKDLIEVLERSKPISAGELATVLAGADARLVVTLASLWELLPRGRRQGHWAQLVARLEQMPVAFVRSVDITPLEFREAVRAFKEAREPSSIASQIFVSKWYETFWRMPKNFDEVLAKTHLDMLVGMSLVRQVGMVLDVTDDRSRRRTARDRFAAQLAAERRWFASLRDYEAFRYLAIETMARLDDPLPEPYEEFIRWLYDNPRRAPGWRVALETRAEMRADMRYKPKVGDLSDLVHLHLLPYVTFFTADAAVATLARQAIKRLDRTAPTDLTARIHPTLPTALAELARATA